MRAMWTQYFAQAHAVIFVVDSTDPGRLDEVLAEISKLAEEAEVEDVPFLVLCNKSDLPQAADVVDLKEKLNPVMEQLNARECRVMSISAIEGIGVENSLTWIQRAVVRNKSVRVPKKC